MTEGTSPRVSPPASRPGCLRRLATFAGALVVLALLVVAALYVLSELRLNRSYVVPDETVPVSMDPDSVARGQHLARVILGCQECHGTRLQGMVLEDDALLGQIVAPNLTAGQGGIGAYYSDADWIRFMRHGVGRDGKPLILVSSLSLFKLGAQDMAAVIAYMRSLKPVDNELPQTKPNLLARLLLLLQPSALPAFVLDHDAALVAAPEPAVSAEYGEYLANLACSGCHQADFGGGSGPATGRNLTPGGELANWTDTDFRRAIRFGMLPGKSDVLDNGMMPFLRLGDMTNDEIQAIWLYLQSLPAVQSTPTPKNG
jgi:mono/diheme cytochrome c family protein